MTKHFILTGAPGAGKTVVLRQLEVLGFAVVEEAATDVIALAHATAPGEPDHRPGFLEAIVSLQEQRREASRALRREVVFHDRSPPCTLALAEYAGWAPPTNLTETLASINREAFYQTRVLFMRNLGFIKNTEARRISFEETLRFERIHEAVYRRLGFEILNIEPGAPMDRARTIIDSVLRDG